VASSLEEGNRRCPTTSGQAFALHVRGLVDGDADMLLDAVAVFRQTLLAVALASCCEDARICVSSQTLRGFVRSRKPEITPSAGFVSAHKRAAGLCCFRTSLTGDVARHR
jgi:hypothetical protein